MYCTVPETSYVLRTVQLMCDAAHGRSEGGGGNVQATALKKRPALRPRFGAFGACISKHNFLHNTAIAVDMQRIIATHCALPARSERCFTLLQALRVSITTMIRCDCSANYL
jgi:hypothetical protein